MTPPAPAVPPAPQRHAVLVIGSGFAGLGMAMALQRRGIDDFAVLERAAAAGGTWRDNRYPGCACDVPARLYSWSAAPHAHWTRRYAGQAEILAYIERCIATHGLAPHLRYGADLVEARWDDAAALWRARTADGRLFEAPVLVAGLGGLSTPALPKLPGLDQFRGPVLHSARWPAGLDLTGRRVAVVGTGASAIQLVPQLAPRVARLDLYQRTPAWVLPKGDRAYGRVERWLHAHLPLARAARGLAYWQHEARALPLIARPQWLRHVAALAHRHRERQVADAALRARLTPLDTIGCRRILLSDDYYPALQLPQVELVDAAVTGYTADGVLAADGRERPADALVLCTGFQAQRLIKPGLFAGRDGRDLLATWASEAPEAYLGCSVAGFPNLFLLGGPNSGLGHNSMIDMLEAQIAHVCGALDALRTLGLRSVEPRPEVQRAYNARLQARLATSVWASGCRSWYLDRKGRNTVLWPDFSFRFRQRARRFDPADYRLA